MTDAHVALLRGINVVFRADPDLARPVPARIEAVDDDDRAELEDGVAAP